MGGILVRLKPDTTALLLVVTALAAAPHAQTGGWPQYLGTARDGTAAPFSMPSAPRLVQVWRVPLASGMSSVTVASGRAFVLAGDGDADHLVALDASTGREVWRAPLGPTHADAAAGPSSTPAVAGDLVVAVGSSCRVRAVRIADGSIAWERDLAAAYKSRLAARGGCDMSPLVHGTMVVLPTGAADADWVVALDAMSGKPVWSSAEPMRSMSTSLGVTTAPAAQVLYHYLKPPGVSAVAALDLLTGATVWKAELAKGMSANMPLPLPGNRVLLQTWSESSLLEIAPGASPTTRTVWTTAEISADNVPPVHREGHLYGFGGNSGEFLKCIDAATGAVKWSTRVYRGSPLLVDRTLVILSESSGMLRLAAAEPAAYRELAKLDVLKPGARTSAPPSFAEGKIFLRNQEEVVAVAITASRIP